MIFHILFTSYFTISNKARSLVSNFPVIFPFLAPKVLFSKKKKKKKKKINKKLSNWMSIVVKLFHAMALYCLARITVDRVCLIDDHTNRLM